MLTLAFGKRIMRQVMWSRTTPGPKNNLHPRVGRSNAEEESEAGTSTVGSAAPPEGPGRDSRGPPDSRAVSGTGAQGIPSSAGAGRAAVGSPPAGPRVVVAVADRGSSILLNKENGEPPLFTYEREYAMLFSYFFSPYAGSVVSPVTDGSL